jgi:TonB family protein
MAAGFGRLATVVVLVVFFSSGAMTAQLPRLSIVKIRQVSPAYPEQAKRLGVAGNVHLSIVIAPNGTVQEAEVIRGLHPSLDMAAAQAVRQWRYAPLEVNGQPVEVKVNVQVEFLAP